MKKIILAALLFSFIAPIFAGGIAQKMADRAKDLKSLYAEFTQERNLSLLEEISVSKGWLAADDKGFVRWQTNEPFKSAMISDGKSTLHFEFAENKWRALANRGGFPVEKVVEEIRKLVMGDYAGTSYTLAEDGGVLVLTPSNAGARKFVSQIRVTPAADFSYPQKIEVRNPNGDVSIITIASAVKNPKNIAEAFITSPLQEYKPE